MNRRIGARGWVLRVGVVATLSWLWANQARAAGPPAKLTLAPTTLEMVAGQTAPVTAKLLDAAGAETTVEANSQVGFAVDVSSVAAVTIDPTNPLVGNVMAKRAGMTAVRAFYVRDGQQTNIFAASDLTVTAGPDGGALAEPDAAAIADSGAGPADGGASPSDGGAADVSVSSCPWTMCGTTCTDLHQDQANCGQCGHACLSGQSCVAGACITCPADSTLCSGECVTVRLDPRHCGGCGHACAAGDICKEGVCAKKEGGCAMIDVGPGSPAPVALALFLAGVASAILRRRRR